MQRLLWLGVAVFIIFADQYSKWFITQHVILPELYGQNGVGFFEWYSNIPHALLSYANIAVTPYFNIVMAWNTGVSFSMFSGMGGHMPLILIAVSLFITMFFGYYLFKSTDKMNSLCYALVIGGALGNVIDRARFGAVIDFLDFHAYGYHWPAFNIADMSIVIGISMLIIVSLFFDLTKKDGYRNQHQNKTTFGS